MHRDCANKISRNSHTVSNKLSHRLTCNDPIWLNYNLLQLDLGEWFRE